jgi:hypothetical protein
MKMIDMSVFRQFFEYFQWHFPDRSQRPPSFNQGPSPSYCVPAPLGKKDGVVHRRQNQVKNSAFYSAPRDEKFKQHLLKGGEDLLTFSIRVNIDPDK